MGIDAEKWDFPAPPESLAVEKGSRELIRDIQASVLKKAVKRAWENVPMYKRLWGAAGLHPDQIKGLEDLPKLPLVTKETIRLALENYPPYGDYQGNYQFMRVQSSSGSTGKPTPMFFTRRDWETLSNLQARRFVQAGVQRGDVAQVCLTYSLFIAGFLCTEGVQKAGAMAIPAGSGAVTPTKRQIDIAKEWGTTVLVSTPSYVLYLAETACADGINVKDELKVRLAIVTGEPLTEAMRQKIQDWYGCKCYNAYGTVELPVVGAECPELNGMHINEDAYVCEIVHPETGQPLPDGQEGVLVVTAAYKEAGPLIRWRTGDITHFITEPCSCGRTIRRIAGIQARADDMLKVRGVSLYPTAVEPVIAKFPELGSEYLIELDQKASLDTIKVNFEYIESRAKDLELLKEKVAQELWARLNVRCEVELMPLGKLGSLLGAETRVKSAKKRVIDRRPKQF